MVLRFSGKIIMKRIYSIILILTALSLYAGNEDRAIAILDMGELSTTTSNFGLFSEFHFYAPSMHWPSWAVFQQQYCFGLGPFAAVQDNVIESFISRTYFDWEAKDGSLGDLHSGDLETPDGMPIMAISDADTTWPRDEFGERFWPGRFRKDPETGEEIPGEFVSERDAFCIFNDAYNPKGSLGIKTRQTTYSFGRAYAEDFIFFDLEIINTSDSTIHNMYWGYHGAFRPDYDFKDYLYFCEGDFIYYEDGDGIPHEPWETMGMIGVCILKTPYDMGITDFHYFDRTYKPLTDEQLWPVVSSDTACPNIEPSYYFHGDDVRIDNTDLIGEIPYDSLRAWNFIISTGAFDFLSGDTIHSAIVVVAGFDSSDLFTNLSEARLMAARDYLGSGPPSSPIVNAVAGDKKVTLYWEAEPSESSIDPRTGLEDFEGYKVYKSTDEGMTWGETVTDEYGRTVGFVPIAIFDLKDGIKGRDPAFPQSLGEDTGLRHTFIDTNIINGVEYWYCVTAYDQGNQNPDSLEQSYESPKGRPGSPNVVSVIPGVHPSGFNPGEVIGGDTLQPISGVCEGLALVSVIDPMAITGHTYEISFNDSVPYDDTTYITTFNLVDISISPPCTLFYNHYLSDSSLDNIPVVGGFRLTLFNSSSGVKSMGWTKVNGDTCTFEWWRWIGDYSSMVREPYIYGASDFRIVVDYDANSIFGVEDGCGGDTLTIEMPIRVFDITDTLNPVDVSEYCWLLDYRYSNAFSPQIESLYFSPEGWDLIPGGAGFTPPEGVALGFFDQIGCWNSKYEAVYFATQNGPGDAIPPSDGDEFTIITFKPFTSEIKYIFNTEETEIEDIGIEGIKVVPNPYIVSAEWEKVWYEKKLQFTNLPEECEIRIYTVSGDIVATVSHNSKETGYEFWDMRNESGVEVSYGLYVYVVETPKGQKYIGKFVVIK
ncbi:hypothetical protein KAX02_08205 [candidate division WOR-3 bacterium]|nr:hypothetical protein [candidate division WOR-3 bacterium]